MKRAVQDRLASVESTLCQAAEVREATRVQRTAQQRADKFLAFVAKLQGRTQVVVPTTEIPGSESADQLPAVTPAMKRLHEALEMAKARVAQSKSSKVASVDGNGGDLADKSV